MSLQEVHEKINRQAVLAARAQATARNLDAQLRWSDTVLTLLERCNVAEVEMGAMERGQLRALLADCRCSDATIKRVARGTTAEALDFLFDVLQPGLLLERSRMRGIADLCTLGQDRTPEEAS